MALPNVPISQVPASGPAFPALDSITVADLVGPRAANRQPVSLDTRTLTLREQLNLTIEAVNALGTGGSSVFLPRDGSLPMSGHLDMANYRIFNLGDPTADSHALNRSYADARYVNVTGDTMSGALQVNNTLGASGAVTFTSTLRVDGHVDFNSTATFDNLLTITAGGIDARARILLNNNTPLYGKTTTGTPRSLARVDNVNQAVFGDLNLPAYIDSSVPIRRTTGASQYPIWDAGNQGAGTGLDADLLDGLHGSAYSRLDLASVQTHAGKIRSPSTDAGDAGTTLVTKDYAETLIASVSVTRRMEITEPSMVVDSNVGPETRESGWFDILWPIQNEATFFIPHACAPCRISEYISSADCGIVSWVGHVDRWIPSMSKMIVTHVDPVWTGATLTGVSLRCMRTYGRLAPYTTFLQEAPGGFTVDYTIGVDTSYKRFATHFLNAGEYSYVEGKVRVTGSGASFRVQAQFRIVADGWTNGSTDDTVLVSGIAFGGVQMALG